jgi:endonuclease-8
MPEGHTLHLLARRHQRYFAGSPVAVSSPQGRFAPAAAVLDGRVLQRADAVGKHLFHVYGPDLVVHMHLGLYGGFTDAPLPVEPPRGQVRMRLVGATHWTDLRGPTACELLTGAQVDAVRARLGPDPLRRDADPDRAWARICRSRAPLATLLLDQSVLAGVGNVYRAEVLFRAGIDPHRPGREVDHDEWMGMWDDLCTLLRSGVRAGRIVTTRPEDRPRRGRPRREDSFYVYRRTGEPCRICGTEIRTETMATRNLFWCPTCQAT